MQDSMFLTDDTSYLAQQRFAWSSYPTRSNLTWDTEMELAKEGFWACHK